MNEGEIIERIMTQHWDLATCPCWICKAGRGLGLKPREEYLGQDRALVRVKGATE